MSVSGREGARIGVCPGYTVVLLLLGLCGDGAGAFHIHGRTIQMHRSWFHCRVDFGSDSAQDEVADMMIEEMEAEGMDVDEDCVRDAAGELSDDDAQAIVDQAVHFSGLAPNMIYDSSSFKPTSFGSRVAVTSRTAYSMRAGSTYTRSTSCCQSFSP